MFDIKKKIDILSLSLNRSGSYVYQKSKFYLFSLYIGIAIYISPFIYSLFFDSSFFDLYIFRFYSFTVQFPLAFIILIFLFNFSEKINPISIYFKSIKYEKEFDSKFGSVHNVFKIYNKLLFLEQEISDENFYRILNETKTFQKIEHIDDRYSLKIKKINEKIRELKKEKNELISKSQEKQKNIFNRNKSQ